MTQDRAVVKTISEYCEKVTNDLGRKYVVLVTHADKVGDIEYADFYERDNEERNKVLKALCSSGECALDHSAVFFVSNDVSDFKGEMWKNEATRAMTSLRILQYIYANIDESLENMIQQNPALHVRLQPLAQMDRSVIQSSGGPLNRGSATSPMTTGCSTPGDSRKFVFQMDDKGKVKITLSHSMSADEIMNVVSSHSKFTTVFRSEEEIYFHDIEDDLELEDGDDFFSHEGYGTPQRPVYVERRSPIM
mmetsp:Transcript_10975/g.40874  ORF Transcript_10975/g.40874 Transcript_10975/m.40874 type:complete len:249 (+) Transcript_10975:2-748(+)